MIGVCNYFVLRGVDSSPPRKLSFFLLLLKVFFWLLVCGCQFKRVPEVHQPLRFL